MHKNPFPLIHFQPHLAQATSGQQYYSATLDYTTTADDEVSLVKGIVATLPLHDHISITSTQQQTNTGIAIKVPCS